MKYDRAVENATGHKNTGLTKALEDYVDNNKTYASKLYTLDDSFTIKNVIIGTWFDGGIIINNTKKVSDTVSDARNALCAVATINRIRVTFVDGHPTTTRFELIRRA